MAFEYTRSQTSGYDTENYQQSWLEFPKMSDRVNDYKAYYTQSQILANSGNYQEALATLDRALSIKSDNHQAWIYRGGLFTHLDRYEEALASFEQALTLQPHDQTAALFRGVALHHLGRYKQAYASYNQALGTKRPSRWQKLLQIFKKWVYADFVGA
ncbi:MAG TPA: hypothetical protein DDZ80_25360 [Cyanobacteria bacterium UBA8803]|nr:hypothetical protein [Cyanobacteria bacterium UBA8803]